MLHGLQGVGVAGTPAGCRSHPGSPLERDRGSVAPVSSTVAVKMRRRSLQHAAGWVDVVDAKLLAPAGGSRADPDGPPNAARRSSSSRRDIDIGASEGAAAGGGASPNRCKPAAAADGGTPTIEPLIMVIWRAIMA